MPAYEFSSKPRAVKHKLKFRPDSDGGAPADQFLPVNIHHDPRVARGNTFAGDRRSDSATAFSSELRPTKNSNKSNKRRSRSSSSSLFENTVSQPSLREDLDLSRYLIEPGEDIATPEHEAETQTDVFEPRPQTPDFVPKKTGVDVSTQIEESDKLFDLEREIQPLLDVLVGKTLEQARIEVEREHELECIRQAATTLNRERADEARRVLDLKEAAVLAEREKEELRRRRREEANRRRVAKEKVACLQLMRQVLPLSLERAFTDLSKKSWTTPTVHQIKTEFLPWLFERVSTTVDQRFAVVETVGSLLVSVDAKAEAARIQRIESRRWEEEAKVRATRIARERSVKLFIPAELVGGEDGERLGPVSVRAGDTVKDTEAKVISWLANEGGMEEVTAPDGGFLAGYLREARRIRGGPGLGKKSMLMDLQEEVGVSDEVLLRVDFDS